MIKILIVVTTIAGSSMDIGIDEVAKLDHCLNEAPIYLRAVKMVKAVEEAKVECIERTRKDEKERWKDEVKIELTTEGWDEANARLTTAQKRDPGAHRFDPGYQSQAGGFDRYGYDRYGFDRYGYDRYGYDRYGYDRYGYDRYGYDRYGYHRSWPRQPGEPGHSWYGQQGQTGHTWRGQRFSRYMFTLCREFPDRPECARYRPYSPQSVPVPDPSRAVPLPSRPVQDPAYPIRP